MLTGDISIGDGTVIHPKVELHARTGPIVIGANVLIEDRVRIVNDLPPTADGQKQTLTVGDNSLIDVDAGWWLHLIDYLCRSLRLDRRQLSSGVQGSVARAAARRLRAVVRLHAGRHGRRATADGVHGRPSTLRRAAASKC